MFSTIVSSTCLLILSSLRKTNHITKCLYVDFNFPLIKPTLKPNKPPATFHKIDDAVLFVY